MKKETQIELTPEETKLAPITQIESQLLEIKKSCQDLKIQSPTDKAGFNLVVEKRKALKSLNVLIEKNRKMLVEEAVSWQKQVNSAAKTLSSMVDEVKAPLELMENDFILAAEKEKQRVEAERQAKIQQRAEQILAFSARYNGTHFVLGNVSISQSAIERLSDEDFASEIELVQQEFNAIAEADRLEKEAQQQERDRLKKEREELEAEKELLRKEREAINIKKGEQAAESIINGTIEEGAAALNEYLNKRIQLERDISLDFLKEGIPDQSGVIHAIENNLYPVSVMNNLKEEFAKQGDSLSYNKIDDILKEGSDANRMIPREKSTPVEVIGEAITEPQMTANEILFALEKEAVEKYGTKPSLVKAFKEGALWMQEKMSK